MLAQMTSTQFAEWEHMYQWWHMGDSPHERDDVSAAIVAQTVANVHMKKPLKLDTFLPTFTAAEPQEQTADQLHAKMLALANRRKPRRGNDKQIAS